MGNSIIEAQQEYFEFHAPPNGVPLILKRPPHPDTARVLWDAKIRNETAPVPIVIQRRRYGVTLNDAFPRWFIGIGHGPP